MGMSLVFISYGEVVDASRLESITRIQTRAQSRSFLTFEHKMFGRECRCVRFLVVFLLGLADFMIFVMSFGTLFFG